MIKKRKTFGQADLSDEELEKLKAFEMMSRNKRSIMLDMRNPTSRVILERLIKQSDVLVSDYRPGVLDESGLGYEDVKKLNPSLIYCAISLCGQTGPYRDVPGHDPVSLAVSGVLTRFHNDKESPDPIGVPISDINSALHATIGILMALRARDTTGVGQLVDISMSDTAFAFVTPSLSRYLVTGEVPRIGMNMANNGVWKTKDDLYVCTTDMEPRYWISFCELIERPDWKSKIHKRHEYEDELREIFKTRTRDEWIAAFREYGTQGAPVLGLPEIVDDPHAREREVIQNVEGHDGVTHIGPLIKMSDTPGKIDFLARMPGADTRDVLAELEFSPEEIENTLTEIKKDSDPRLTPYLDR